MGRVWWLSVSISWVIAMTLVPDGFSSAQEVRGLTADAGWDSWDREDLLGYARATWHSFELMTAANGLPSDFLKLDSQGEWRPSKRTSPTDIACFLWATLSAGSLSLIDDAETNRRIEATLATLGQMERDHGFFYNLYDVETASRLGVGGDKDHPSRLFLSSVDNGWLAAALMMVCNTRPALRARAEALLQPMDFGYFYTAFDPADPTNKPGQFHGGCYTDDRTFTSFYGMLNTEPRILSYIAIARRQVPPEHYYRLFRTLPMEHGKQSQVPKGDQRSYLGVSVFEGHYEYRGLEIVPSWGGSMFEALMVPLLVPEEHWSPRSWGLNHRLYVRAQIEEGLTVRKYGYWGFSPSATPEGGYQTYGVNLLGTEVDGYRTYETSSVSKPKGDPPVRPAREGVVTPHAAFLSLRYAPRESLANLRALIKAFPILDAQGFHDSVNVTTGEVSHCVLSLDQGMILVAIANALADDAMRRAFSQGLIEDSIRPLIAPEEFTVGDRRP